MIRRRPPVHALAGSEPAGGRTRRRWRRVLRSTGLAVVAAAGVAVAAAAVAVAGPLLKDRAGGGADAVLAEWEHISKTVQAVWQTPTRLLADPPRCDPPVRAAGTPEPSATMYPSDGTNRLLVSAEHSSCVEVHVEVPRGPDIRYIWEPPGAGLFFEAQDVWIQRSVEVEWTVTAHGPGGSSTATGTRVFHRGSGS